MSPLVAMHAFVAVLALGLGGVNLIRRVKGDPMHRLIGRVWLGLMYVVTLSSFGIRQIFHGHFGPIHLLSIFTFVTISIGLWAARTGRIAMHRGYMRGSWIGATIAGTLAVAIPRRDIPQFTVHHPAQMALVVVAWVVVSVAVVETCRRLARAGRGVGRVAA